MADLSTVSGPLIEPDAPSQPFFDGARRGELMLRRCASCQRWLAPQVRYCPQCGATELNWERALGSGVLITWAVVHTPPHRDFADQVPFITGYVELAEGPWMPARIVGSRGEDLRPGFALTVAFVHPTEGASYPVFGPARPPSGPDGEARQL